MNTPNEYFNILGKYPNVYLQDKRLNSVVKIIGDEAEVKEMIALILAVSSAIPLNATDEIYRIQDGIRNNSEIGE